MTQHTPISDSNSNKDANSNPSNETKNTPSDPPSVYQLTAWASLGVNFIFTLMVQQGDMVKLIGSTILLIIPYLLWKYEDNTSLEYYSFIEWMINNKTKNYTELSANQIQEEIKSENEAYTNSKAHMINGIAVIIAATSILGIIGLTIYLLTMGDGVNFDSYSTLITTLLISSFAILAYDLWSDKYERKTKHLGKILDEKTTTNDSIKRINPEKYGLGENWLGY